MSTGKKVFVSNYSLVLNQVVSLPPAPPICPLPPNPGFRHPPRSGRIDTAPEICRKPVGLGALRRPVATPSPASDRNVAFFPSVTNDFAGSPQRYFRLQLVN